MRSAPVIRLMAEDLERWSRGKREGIRKNEKEQEEKKKKEKEETERGIA